MIVLGSRNSIRTLQWKHGQSRISNSNSNGNGDGGKSEDHVGKGPSRDQRLCTLKKCFNVGSAGRRLFLDLQSLFPRN